MTMVLRTGASSKRVTQGRRYYLSGYGKIMDDNGDPMKPSINRPDYWAVVPSAPAPMTAPLVLPDNFPAPSSIEVTVGPNATKETIMKIENVTRIDGRDADSYSEDELLSAIEQQQKMSQRLVDIGIDSPAIKRLSKKHAANIERLVGILDERDDS